MKKYYNFKELSRKSIFDIRKICLDEKLIESYRENLNREELINIVLKYRSKANNLSIDIYKTNGLERMQELLDIKLRFKFSDSQSIKIPHKLVMYKGMELTVEDDYKITIPDHVSENNAFLINGNGYLCGIFQLIRNIEERNSFYLVGNEEFFRLDNLKNQNYSLLFFTKSDKTHLFNAYNGVGKAMPHTLDYYELPLDSFQMLNLEKTDCPLCIDFGSANTTAGLYLDKHYIKELPKHKILSGSLNIDEINYVEFNKKDEKKSKVLPTLVYVQKCFDENNIEYLFGYDVEEKLKGNNYNLRGSIFYGIKNWVKTINEKEKIVDENGNIRYTERKNIIRAYINYIVNRAEANFKCKFKYIHITTPVKLKRVFLNMFKEILPEYKIIEENALDEGIAVLYNSIERMILKKKFEENKEYKGLIIDCGGGTTDLASCTFKVKSEEINYTVDIKTTFENSEESFGGNNITYRIMQYLKIVLAKYYLREPILSINELIDTPAELIFDEVDVNGVDKIYEKIKLLYAESETVIPTKFSGFENKASDVYVKIKNNFFFLWETAELLKREMFKNDTTVRVKFDKVKYNNSDLSSVYLPSWNLTINEDGKFKNMSGFPPLIVNKSEILKLLKGDVYEVFRRFLTSYYETGVLYDYSLLKLSGQTCKVNLFSEILKEFVPGKMVDFRRNVKTEEQELKISCVDGAIRYLNSSKVGNIKVNIQNDIPIVPYALKGKKYTGEETEILRIGEKTGSNHGMIKKTSLTGVLPLYLVNKEEEVKKHFTYLNKSENYVEKDELEILSSLEGYFKQDSLDQIQNNETGFFVYTDKNYWGFYVIGVKRESEQLYLGKTEYFSFEEDITTVSFFDGKH